MEKLNLAKYYLIVFSFFNFYSCHSQKENKLIGGPCEGCEAIFEYSGELDNTDTLPGFEQNEPKLLVSGTVYNSDGITPASDIILYVYHTNREGIYETQGDENGWGKRHGFIRGWIKTDEDGKYFYYTFRPASYPDRSEPEHIHIIVKEPDKNEYYLSSFFFEDDPLLTSEEREKDPQRGGSGICNPVKKNGMLEINRDIILGLNIPDYKES